MLLVLAAIVLLSFAAYTFAELMLNEHTAARAMSQHLELRCLAESGVEATAAWLDGRPRRDAEPPGWFQSPQLFAKQPAPAGMSGLGHYSIVPDLAALNSDQAVFGLWDESGKLNLNTLPLEKGQRKMARTQLLALPGMTPQTADAILDWMDPDDDPSAYGAETSYYSARHPAYRPRQGRLTSLEELLLVRGVTRELLYGEDANGNGLLDANENDGTLSEPRDNADGVLQRGWSQFITLVSAESNLRRNGTPKINVNHPNLVELHDALEREFDAKMARFIVAWRLVGSIDSEENPHEAKPQTRTGVSTTQKSSPEDADALEAARDAARLRARRQLGLDDPAGDAHNPKTPDREVIRGGLDLARRPVFSIRSMLDLIGTDVRIDIDREDTVLRSPWKAEGANLERSLLLLNDKLTTTDGAATAGRINVNTAPREVLLAIPQMTEPLAAAILNARG
ncbi:MAG TPA: hypothetical protein VK137_12375, partial [Planctomycetaceae bacterium]|nr:hypothetical protein [Planctomycetaceae bacterium]